MDSKEERIICHDINNKETAVKVDQLVWRPSVYGLLIEEGRILLSSQRGGYDFPGGGVNLSETLAAALEREFFEETGLRVRVGQAISSQTSFYNSGVGGPFWNCPLMYFLVERVGGELSLDYLDEEEKSYTDWPAWLDLKDIDNLKFYNSIDSPALIRQAIKIKNLL